MDAPQRRGQGGEPVDAQTFKSVYPNEPLIAPLAQMAAISASPRPIAARGADEFVALSAGFGERWACLPRRDIIASLEYKDRALMVKVKPNTVDAARWRSCAPRWPAASWICGADAGQLEDRAAAAGGKS
jgi:hypothetical protein